MFIKSIHLNNIRSYVNQKIDFNKGITVLSGDIGSGKSSVLLALEFALFGIGDSGNSLLRKGENDGSVEVNFSINEKEFSVKRFLKRKSEGIRQQNGYIVYDGIKKDLTPVELKDLITSILGYPKDNSNKKSLIYRYTTYTPQDEMKSVLYEDNEERINIIRKIFGIDKYQRIIENSSVFTKFLRENKREMLGRISDLESKKEEIKKSILEKNEFIKSEKEYELKLNELKTATEAIKNKLSSMESELKKTNELKREKLAIETAIKHKEEQKHTIAKEIEKLEFDITVLRERTDTVKVEELKKKIKPKIRDEIFELDKEQLNLQKTMGEIEGMKNHSEKIKTQIKDLDDCPLCLQKVEHQHKDKIISSEETKLRESEVKLREVKDKIFEIKKGLVEKNNELHESNNSEKELSLINLHVKNKVEKEVAMNERKLLYEKMVNEIIELNKKNNEMKLPDSEAKEKEYELTRKELEKAAQNERTIEIEKTKITSNIKNNEKLELMLKKEVEEKEKTRIRFNEASVLENWIQNNFSNIISLMERHVLGSVYSSFNDFFKEMFDLLIEDERLTASINESFTPVIEQNGHETEFENLSGGEKTSLCLAYRLALHKAINSIISGIKTRELLLLDEPTDGFSSEQIDKMKDLFEKLNANQTIIVSHENKIESIADHVMRIVKNGHESKILA